LGFDNNKRPFDGVAWLRLRAFSLSRPWDGDVIGFGAVLFFITFVLDDGHVERKQLKTLAKIVLQGGVCGVSCDGSRFF
jgi:hypothetical protein